MSTPSGRLPVLALAVMLALAPAASFAEQNAEADTRDEEAAGEQQAGQQKQIMPAIEVIRVRGQRIPHAYDETGSVVLLNRAAIERHQPLSTEDVLRRVPGINIKVEEETAIVSNFGIRGLSASESKALVLEDGVPIAPGLFIGNTRYFNPRIQRVERVEILKGSASLRYGPSTIGGVINYVTKSPDDGILLSSRLGSFNLREVSIEAGNRSASGDGFAGLVATHARSDGFMDKGYEMSDVLLKSGLALNENQRIGLKLSYHDNTANISYRGLLLDDYRNGETYNPAPDDYYLQDRVAVDLTHEWDLSPDSHLKTLVYWSDVSRDYWR
jgi:Fe(3+) dicitrate transport protein